MSTSPDPNEETRVIDQQDLGLPAQPRKIVRSIMQEVTTEATLGNHKNAVRWETTVAQTNDKKSLQMLRLIVPKDTPYFRWPTREVGGEIISSKEMLQALADRIDASGELATVPINIGGRKGRIFLQDDATLSLVIRPAPGAPEGGAAFEELENALVQEGIAPEMNWTAKIKSLDQVVQKKERAK